jgi:hypothetical protein
MVDNSTVTKEMANMQNYLAESAAQPGVRKNKDSVSSDVGQKVQKLHA